MVFNVLKVFGDQVADVVRAGNVTFGETRKKAPALCDPERGIDDCFGPKSMNFTVLDTEDITRRKWNEPICRRPLDRSLYVRTAPSRIW